MGVDREERAGPGNCESQGQQGHGDARHPRPRQTGDTGEPREGERGADREDRRQGLQVPEELDVGEEEHGAVDGEPGTEDDRRRRSGADGESEEEGDTDDRQQSGGWTVSPAQELFELVGEGEGAGIDPSEGDIEETGDDVGLGP
jgi:hypothetical protein